MSRPEPHPNHQSDSLTSPSLSLSSILSKLFPRLEETKQTGDSAPPVTGPSILIKKAVVGLVGVAYMCLLLMTVMLVSVVIGVGFVRFWVEEPVHLQQRLYFDYRDDHPSAVLDFGIEGYHKLVKIVPVGHTCNVRLAFVMPESDYNREIGMFQVVAESLSLNGEVITSSSRPCMLRFQSQPVRVMQTFLMAAPLILGFRSEIQMVNLPVLRYKERYHHRTQFIKISLVPRSGTPYLPQIYEANLIVSSELPWMKRLVRNWKWTFCVWTSLYIYFMFLLLLVCFFRSILFPNVSSGYERVVVSDEMHVGPGPVAGRPTSETLRRWRLKRKAMAYGSDETSLSVTRDDDTGTTTEEIGDSESICQ
ncbi:hypothetical protein R6Q57_013440 [Mikania cordata]